MQVKSIAECSAILLTFIKLRFSTKIFVLSIFEWPFYTGFTVHIAWHGSVKVTVFPNFAYNHKNEVKLDRTDPEDKIAGAEPGFLKMWFVYIKV